jgi:ABC-type multidrug transport system fused ATPase/permease subunit
MVFLCEIEAGIESSKKISKIIEYVPKINANSDAGVVVNIKGAYELRNVKFKYENRNVMVLNNVNFSVPASSKFGFTGSTGSGKSTIGQLLIRLYDPTEGEILLDNVLLSDFNVKHLRNCVCWVGQEPILFKGSLLFNVRIGRNDITENDVIEALNKAQAMDIVEKYGLESDVGLRGNKLSGGQKQRVAIARALARKPNVLVLDESTSSLDPITEGKLQNAIMEEKMTVIAIAHRLNTIKDFDQIVVIECGKIVEISSHSDLISKPSGAYKKLWDYQEATNLIIWLLFTLFYLYFP